MTGALFEPVDAGKTPIGGANRSRLSERSPIESLLASPYRFEFNQAVRLLSTHLRRMPEDERPVVRFRNTLSLSFPASEIANIETGRAASRSAARVDRDLAARGDSCQSNRDPGYIGVSPAFMGLLGVTGALPLAYTERFADREASGRDDAARAFLDIFQHRAVTLFHQAWLKHRLPLQYEAHRRDGYLPLVMCIAGLGEPALRKRLRAERGGVSDDALAFYCGLLQRRVVSACHLQGMLTHYFGVPARVTQYLGRWYELDDENQVILGRSDSHLGRDTWLGPRVWQRHMRVRITFGAMSRTQYDRFLPGGSGALALHDLLSLATGVGLDYEISLKLRAADVRSATLFGALLPSEAGSRLGWDSFLISQTSSQDREEIAYNLHDSRRRRDFDI